MRNTMSRFIAVAALAALAAPTMATAARSGAKPIANPAVVERLLDCRKLAPDAERLACYDKAAAAMASATASGDLVAIDREQRRAARRQAFGFTLPSLSFLERGEKVQEANHITATVVGATRDGYGNWIVTLDDGAVWRQVEPVELGRRPHKGSKAVISKGVLGAFFMTIDGEGAGKAKRES